MPQRSIRTSCSRRTTGSPCPKVMESYRAWFGEGPELSVLRMLGLFDRPADEKALGALLSRPAINGLTESLTNLSPTEWQTILARLRRARLLARKDPHNPGHLDTHPLVREYFGEQLRSQRTQAWKEGNRRLYRYYRTLAPQLPDSFREMEPLFLAVICGCNAGLFHEALREVYIPRIQRGDAFFAAKVLGARGALLSVLVHFFEHGRWGSPVEKGVEGQSLTAEDQLDGSLSRFGMHALFLGRFRDRATIRDAPQRCGWILRQIGHLYRIEDTLRRAGRVQETRRCAHEPKPPHLPAPASRSGSLQKVPPLSAPQRFWTGHRLRSLQLAFAWRLSRKWPNPNRQ